MIGGVGQRMLTGVAKKTAAEFFAAVDRDLSGLRRARAASARASRRPCRPALLPSGATPVVTAPAAAGVWTAPSHRSTRLASGPAT